MYKRRSSTKVESPARALPRSSDSPIGSRAETATPARPIASRLTLTCALVVVALLPSVAGAGAGGDQDLKPPSELKLTGATETQLSISWKAAGGHRRINAGYGIYVDGVSVGTTTATDYAFAGMVCGKGYILGVDAFDEAERRSSVATVTASTAACPASTPPPLDMTPPTAPPSIAATAVTAGSVALGWLPSTDNVGVAGYSIFVDSVKVGTTLPTAYTVSLPTCGKTYTFGVEAYDQAANVSARVSVSAATAACPPPTSTVCSKTLSAGGGFSTFLASLKPGDVGCLRGGRYTEGSLVTWSVDATASSRIVLAEYPGEQAEIVGTELLLAGDYLTVRDLTVRDVTTVDSDGISVSGNGDRIEHNVIRNIWRQGILLHTDSRNADVVGNDVREIGQAGSNQYHGIYVQGSGHRVINNVFAQIRGGYGITIYQSPSNVTVAQNTVVGSQTRSGILLDTLGGSITVVNNILIGNADYGIVNRRCDAGGCVVDRNLAWNNRLGAVSGSATNTLQADPKFVDGEYRVASGSPAINAARADFSFSPDRDRTPRPQSGGPDLGAYEK